MTDLHLELTNTRIALYWASTEILDAIDTATAYYAGSTSGAPPRLSVDHPHQAWDGWTRFLRVPRAAPPWLPAGFFDRVVRILRGRGVPFVVQDRRARPEEDVARYPSPIPLYAYQRAAADACTQPSVHPDRVYGQGVIDLAPRAGKTRILLEVHRRLNLPTLWIAPTNAIVDQTATVARGFFDASDVVVASSATLKEAARVRLAITTAAGAINLPQTFCDTRQVLVLDEFHHFVATAAWGREITKRTEHVFYRYGATGTHFRSGNDGLGLEAMLGRVLYRMSSPELRDLGRLVTTDVVYLPITGPRVPRSVGSEFGGGFGRAGIHEHDTRNRYVAAAAVHLHRSGRTVIVIVGTKKQGYEVARLIKANIPPAPPGAELSAVEFVSTDRPRHLQRRIFRSFSEGAEVKILIGTSIIGEGIDLPPADALVWARGEKAAVSLVQGWFRVCTASEGKAGAVIVDFADRHHPRLLDHSLERLRIAAGEPIFRLTILDAPEDFAAWTARLPAPGIRADRAA